MKKIIDIEDDIFQAHCALSNLQDLIEDDATIRHVSDDVVMLDLRGDRFSTINLAPVQHLLDGLRKLT